MSDKQREVEFKGEKFTIEKGIEIPLHRGSPAPWRELIESMEIGDSVVLTKRDGINFQQAVRSYNYKTSLRKIDGERIRVWRIE